MTTPNFRALCTDLLAQCDAGEMAPVEAMEDIRAALARWGHPTTPPAPEPGEVEELVRRLRNRDRWTQLTDAQLERAATLLQPLSAPAIPLPQAGEGEG